MEGITQCTIRGTRENMERLFKIIEKYYDKSGMIKIETLSLKNYENEKEKFITRVAENKEDVRVIVESLSIQVGTSSFFSLRDLEKYFREEVEKIGI